VLAQRQQRGALGLLVGRERFPFRPADGAEEDGLRVAATLESVGRERLAKLVDGGAPHGKFLGFDGEVEVLGGGAEEVEADGHDFGADAVTGENGDFVRFHFFDGINGIDGMWGRLF
jgi:hypothetical protein